VAHRELKVGKSKKAVYLHAEIWANKMDLDVKSAQNYELAKACLRRDEYHTAVIGRTYYAVFLKLKHYLTTKNFDYKQFLADNKYRVDENDYSHGTIRHAIIDYLMKEGQAMSEISRLNKIGHLYDIRIKADYKKTKLTNRDLEDCLDEAKEIIDFINTIEGQLT